MHYRTQKQVIIALITIIFFGAAVFFIMFIFGGGEKKSTVVNPPPIQVLEPVFKDIEIVFTDLFTIEQREKVYDAISQIKNPNLEYGSPHVVYEFIFKDKTGSEIKRISGSTFILANQTRYIIRQAIRLPVEPAGVELNILSQTWKRLAPFDSSGLKIDSISIRRDSNLNATYLTGIVSNGTPYNLREIEVNVSLGDSSGAKKNIAAGATNLQLINRDARREFQILWPAILPHFDIDARVESNFFENDNFVRDYAL